MPEVITNNLDLLTSALRSRSTVGRGINGKLEAYGIKKLRALILELAVRGKLVPQDPNDEPASVLMTRISEGSARLLEEKKNGNPSKVPRISNDEIKFEIPVGWEYVRNGNLFSLRKGRKPENISEKQIGLPYLDIEALDRDNILRFTDDDKCPRATEDDILVVCDGSRSGLVLDGKTGVIGSTLAVIDTPKIIQPYIKLLFMEAYQRLNSTMKGAAIPHLDTNRLMLEMVGLPPLKEQHRIIAKVDELMAICDQLELQQTDSIKANQALVETLLSTLTDVESQQELNEAWIRIANHFDTLFTTEQSVDQLKQVVLQLAIMGKLVPQDPNDEPASVLWEKIDKEKTRLIKEGKLKKQKALPEIGEDEMPFKTPSSWKWLPWGEILAPEDAPFKRGPFGSSLKKDMFVSSGYKVYEQYCPINDDCSFERYYITEEKYESMKAFAVKANDYLVSCSGVTLGRITQVPENFKEGIINQALLRVRINHKYVDKDFFKLLFRSPYFQKAISDNSTGSAIPNVKGVTELKAMPVPLLPLKEQREIVAKVDELMALCDALEVRLNDAQTVQIYLADAIVEQAVF